MNRARSSEAAMLSDASLTRLAGDLGNEWRTLGIFLGLSKAQVDQCFTNRPGDIKAAIVDMLVIWQRETSGSGPEAQVAHLVQALKDSGRVDLAEKVEDGEFIELPELVAGNRENPDQVAGNRLETSGHHNVIIQAGNNANINVNVPAPITESVTPGYTSLPDFSGTHRPYPMPRSLSQGNFQPSMDAILDDCVSQLQNMGFSEQGIRREVRNLMSTGIRTTEDIVQTFVERRTHEEASGQRSSHVHSSKDSVTVSNNEGPVQIGEGNTIRGVHPSAMKKAVQIGKKNRILPNVAGDQNLGGGRDRPGHPTHNQQSFPNNTQPHDQEDRFMDNSTVGEITSSQRNRNLMERLPADRAASLMAREVLPSDGQDWPPIPDDEESAEARGDTSAAKKRSYTGRHGQQAFSMAQLHEQPVSSTFDSLDGPTTGGGKAHPQGEALATPNKAPLYVALPEERSPSKSSTGENQQKTFPQNSTHGSPNPFNDASLDDESLHLQSGDNMQDNQASNWPQTGIPSSTVRPLVDLYPDSSHPSTMSALMDVSIPYMGEQYLPLSPQPAFSLQQKRAESNEETQESDPQLTQNGEDSNIGGTEEPSDLSENQPAEPIAAESGEDMTEGESANSSDEETVPKVPPEEASVNKEAEGASASNHQLPAETQQSVNEGTDGNQPVYDKDRRLYIFSRAHIEQMTENLTSRKIAEGAFGPVYYLDKFPYEGPLKGRKMAVKVNSSDEQGRREFTQELAMAGSRHPHLLPLFGRCEDETCLSLVSPYMVNKDLKSWIQDKKEPTDWKTRLVIGLDLVSAIRYYHKKTEGPNKKFHCDVKSANVFLDAQHRARLGDPGLMREVSRDKTHLTRTGSLSADWGTPYYQDPYYLKYRKYHETSDLYSAGKVLLELLTSITADKQENGRLLFEIWFEELDYFDKDSDGTKLCEVADGSPVVGWPGCSEDGSSISQQFAKLIIGCLQERPRDRIKLEDLHQKLKVLVQRSAAIGKHNTVVPDWCMYCLSCKPCPIPMACGCALLCSGCMKSHTIALYCPNHLMETTGLGHNTFAIIVGQRGFEEDAVGFKDAITDPQICGVREENVKLLKNATIEDVGKAVAEVAGRIQQVQKGQETFFIYYHSGHGKQRGLDFNHTTVWSRNLRKIFKVSKATKSLYILDSCMASSVEVYTMKGPEGPEESSSTSEETENKEQEDSGDNTGCQGSQESEVYMLPIQRDPCFGHPAGNQRLQERRTRTN
ncbi:uncharacterized protein [Branchiostoma lanceolatum]|uniref:uncharacterized protein n=1 Tax=Branchiostoma lanceolatum TaxID=7740 RepID=UPI003451BF11